eukprot:CAMPEP_0117450864 /NCGR_PEP_ID=MMETSP0759-20121206/8696_1 /TAXON_ID=63605 /ORGANISM="Percolomonas cosmopolitus, Strain WS" /LENGTH=172 /DNA_ID=CAMNT_0005243415 /DNA_START=159 /DNA_END=677 /DNA_ORIENTATION=+
MGGHDHHKPDPHTYKNTYGWATPLSELPVYKGSLKRPLKPSAKWRITGPKPDGFKDVATELRLNYTYNHLWRTLDVWNFKSQFSWYLRRVFFKFGVLCVGLFFVACYGEINPYQLFAGHERNAIKSGPMVSPLNALRAPRPVDNSMIKDARFDERLGKVSVEYLNGKGIDLQ